MTSRIIVFIHNSSSENGRKTTASKNCSPIASASAVLANFSCNFDFHSSICPEAWTNFDEKIVNFFLKLVLPVILREIQSNDN